MADFVVAITGASGAVYAVRLLDVLVRSGRNVQLTISPAGRDVLATELDIQIDLDHFDVEAVCPAAAQSGKSLPPSVRGLWNGAEPTSPPLAAQPASSVVAAPERGKVRYFHYQNYMAPLASGSAPSQGMVICPASGGTLSAVAHGASGNLIHRAAAVHLKERRPLIVVPRETPLSIIQLDNLRRLVEAGATVLPAMPGFYQRASCIGDLVDFIVARICDHLAVEHRLIDTWGSAEFPG